jgi:hypothetical protein
MCSRPAGPAPASSASLRRKAGCSATINLPIYGGEPKRQICATNVAFGGPDGLDPRSARLRCVGTKRLQPEARDRPKMADVPGHEYLA